MEFIGLHDALLRGHVFNIKSLVRCRYFLSPCGSLSHFYLHDGIAFFRSIVRFAYSKMNIVWLLAMPRLRQISHSSTAVFSWNWYYIGFIGTRFHFPGYSSKCLKLSQNNPSRFPQEQMSFGEELYCNNSNLFLGTSWYILELSES